MFGRGEMNDEVLLNQVIRAGMTNERVMWHLVKWMRVMRWMLQYVQETIDARKKCVQYCD